MSPSSSSPQRTSAVYIDSHRGPEQSAQHSGQHRTLALEYASYVFCCYGELCSFTLFSFNFASNFCFIRNIFFWNKPKLGFLIRTLTSPPRCNVSRIECIRFISPLVKLFDSMSLSAIIFLISSGQHLLQLARPEQTGQNTDLYEHRALRSHQGA